MSSSLFIEPSSSLRDGKEDVQQISDSNLVVVYGKNGVNINPKDLETLIEEKAVQSISVIRLTSPTPSMENAEEAARLEAEKEAQDSEAQSEELTDSDETKQRDVDEENKPNSGADTEEDLDSDDAQLNKVSENDESSENNSKSEKPKKRLRRRVTRNKRKLANERKKGSELVGLTFEGFYEAEAALEIAKGACKMAGIPFIRNKAEYEFQLFVIKNDHCYTPFTSPEQMKAKLHAEKLEAEKLGLNIRKQPQINIQSKQVFIKARKPLVTTSNISTANVSRISTKKSIVETKQRLMKEKMQLSVKSDDVSKREEKLLNSAEDEDDEEDFELFDIDDTEDSASEKSAESDNDRDSDLDFDVSKRQLKKRRLPFGHKKVRRLQHATNTTTTTSSGSIVNTGSNVVQRVVLPKQRFTTNNLTISQRQVRQPQILPISSNIQKTVAGATTIRGINKIIAKNEITTLPKLQRSGPIVKIVPPNPNSPRSSTSQQTVKEIVLNKVMSSPKGKFTELTTLISDAENSPKRSNPIQSQCPTTPTTSKQRTNITQSIASGSTPTRVGFMRIDAASKNQLPAQISIETHHSSNELAAENDKQLDLIDSIVKDELNKSIDRTISEKSSIGINENIPKIVQMLESTEKALESNKAAAATTSTTTASTSVVNETMNINTINTHVDDIDISHDLPEELLQHVVDLIEDDKTLQEAVEKQILEGHAFGNENAVADTTLSMMQEQPQQQQHEFKKQLMQISPPQTTTTTTMSMILPTTSKSIIQMSISNVGSPISNILTTPDNTPRASPTTRTNSIQIVRGNGRVITLPPIEAPTTRAKRRAQVVPSPKQQLQQQQQQQQQTIQNTDGNIVLLNESSLDSSLHSNSSFSTATVVATSTDINVSSTPTSSIDKTQRETLSKRRTSKELASSSSVFGVSTANKSTRKSSGAGAGKPHVNRRSGGGNNNKQEDNDASESQADDDDPDKLWCICRQPHNNRFMICCDTCGDWFHGTCVSVTKAMGREMEQKGIEWCCPQCIKKREEKKQRKLTDMLQVQRSNSRTSVEEKHKLPMASINIGQKVETTTVTTPSTPTSSTPNQMKLNPKKEVQTFVIQQMPQTGRKTTVVLSGQKKLITPTNVGTVTKGKMLATTPVRAANTSSMSTVTTPNKIEIINTCVSCRKAARPNMVYCSEECIRRCAQHAITVYTAKSTEQNENPTSSSALDDKKKKGKGLFEDLLCMADRKPKVERITVFERKSGTRLMGLNAPTTLTIKKWLHENPTFEIVLPGSQLSMEIEQKLKQQKNATLSRQIVVGRMPNVINDTLSTPGTGATAMNKMETVQSSGIKESPSPSAVSAQHLKTYKKLHDEQQKPPLGNVSSVRPNTPKQKISVYTITQQLKSEIKPIKLTDPKEDNRSKERQVKRQTSESSTGGSIVGGPISSHKKSTESVASSSTSSESEPIRMNVRRTLKEQILSRMKEAPTDNPKLTIEEVDTFVKQMEIEMYNVFSRDTGTKYKAKYRSLMFNIKDRKNHTLFTKICAKEVDPKQLVHMTPEELASQELAKWRENENKHQLEMIKKSELEMLSCTKNYLFKNHKGEEILESKVSDVCVNLDITTPVEELVNVFNSSALGNSFEMEEAETAGSDSMSKHFSSPAPSGSDTNTIIEHEQHQNQHQQQQQQHHHHHHQHHQHSNEKIKHRHDSDKEREREREHRHHRSRDRHHRDKSRSRRRSHSRSKSRSRSQEKRHHQNSSTHTHTHTHKDRRDRQRGYEQEKERERDHVRERKDTKILTDHKSITTSKPTTKEKHRNSPVNAKKQHQQQSQNSQVECFSLIDQIIESSKTVEEAANLVQDAPKDKQKDKSKDAQHSSEVFATSSTSMQISGIENPTPQCNSSTADSDQEPTSTVSIPTPPHDPYSVDEEPSFSRTNSPTVDLETTFWSGCICMNEVATLQVSLQQLIGNSRHFGKLLPESLEVVGRINNDTVWDYLYKIRKSPNKQIVLIRLSPLTDDDIDGYGKLFAYLNQKKRLGVIKSTTPQIKDFYIYPLASGKQMPKVLQVTNQNDFYNDPYRSDLIIGIFVCVLSKRTVAMSTSSAASSVDTSKGSRRHRNETTNFTPPGSPKRKKRTKTDIEMDAIIKAPIANKSTKSSIADDDGDADEPYSPGGSSDDDIVSMYTSKPSSSTGLNLPSADDELKRKMEEINRQIAAQEMEIAGLLNVEPSAASASVLANISIPSNLPQILASIKSKESPNMRTPTGTMPTNADSTLNTMSTIPQLPADYDEYSPEDAICSSYTLSVRQPVNPTTQPTTSTSRLAQLSEAELLSMVPDDVFIEPPPTKSSSFSNYDQEPPPPGI